MKVGRCSTAFEPCLTPPSNLVHRGPETVLETRATLPAPPVVPLGGAFLPPENARRLHIFQYAETMVMRAMAGWIPLAPELDVKIELARQVAFAAERADALWKRVAQLLWPEERDVRVHAAVVRLLRAADEEAPSSAALLAGLGRVVLPRLAEAYRAHAAEADPVTDTPTIRLLERLAPEVDALAAWAAG